MFHIPDYYQDLSVRLSEVLDNIGVNETCIMAAIKASLLSETMETITRSADSSVYKLGSSFEGTTTVGLDSDVDTLYCNKRSIVLQDYTEWQPGLVNLLMIKNDYVSPGYCHLQVIRSDTPLPDTSIMNKHYFKVRSDMVLLQNTFIKSLHEETDGPSWVLKRPGLRGIDLVPAFFCKSWPDEARQWLHRRSVNIWPTPEVKRFAENSGVFVVPVGSKVSQNEALEWRISTSLAERCLMINLNITQIKCYILMKMILKTYLHSQGESLISSYMCKSVLLYCIQDTQPSAWKEMNLISCLFDCVQRLHICVLSRNCPYFILPRNNLMAGKYSGKIKQELQYKLFQILKKNIWTLFGIQIDDLSTKLMVKLNILQNPVQAIIPSRFRPEFNSSYLSVKQTAELACSLHGYVLHKQFNGISETEQQKLLQYLHVYITAYRYGNLFEQSASIILTPLICSTVGSIIASLNLQRKKGVSSKALAWLHDGLNSDVSSGRLKLASVLYCSGDMVRTEVILREIERRYDSGFVEPSSCYNDHPNDFGKTRFIEETFSKNIEQSIKENIAFCVTFTHPERYCTPNELRYEMFRSTQDNLLHRKKEDFWMDWAVVDSLPYLYFLQYKTYGQLQKYTGQHLALINLIDAIMNEKNLGHKETAYNLLGQCMEQENRIRDAFICYQRSLDIRERNNLATVHICRLLAA